MYQFSRDPLYGYTESQRAWVMAKLGGMNDADAAREAGISPSTCLGWNCKDELDELVAGLRAEPFNAAMAKLYTVAERAMQVKIDGLNSKSERIRQAAATELLDRILGKPSVHIDADVRNDAVDKYTLILRKVIDVTVEDAPDSEKRALEDMQLLPAEGAEDSARGPREDETGSGGREGWEEQVHGNGGEHVGVSEPVGAVLDSGS